MAELMSAEEILRRLQSRARVPDYPPAGDRKVWTSLPPEKIRELIRLGEVEQNNPLPFLGARDYMKFFRSGNRIDYERPYFRRRGALCSLVLAECAEYKGRFFRSLTAVADHITGTHISGYAFFNVPRGKKQ